MSEKDNESAVFLTETKNKFDNIINEKYITNDNKLFKRAVLRLTQKAKYAKSVRSALREPSGYLSCMVVFIYQRLLVE